MIDLIAAADGARPRLRRRRRLGVLRRPLASPATASSAATALDDLRPGHRFEGGVDPAKRFHADWALWKRAQDTRTQMVWDTPWGVGFPGWHTECSAMSLALLGDAIDVHTGGIDLRFPHHEDERAQSNSATGTDVVRHWVHGEHLLFEGRKMSKSAGNVVLRQDVVDARARSAGAAAWPSSSTATASR